MARVAKIRLSPKFTEKAFEARLNFIIQLQINILDEYGDVVLVAKTERTTLQSRERASNAYKECDETYKNCSYEKTSKSRDLFPTGQTGQLPGPHI